jgi:hypothetical protein
VGRLGSRRLGVPFPRFAMKASVLEECVGEHRHEDVAVQASPGAALEVIEPEVQGSALNPSTVGGPACAPSVPWG